MVPLLLPFNGKICRITDSGVRIQIAKRSTRTMEVTNRYRRTDLWEFNSMERMLSPRSFHASSHTCRTVSRLQQTAVALDGVNPAFLAGDGIELEACHTVVTKE